MPGVMLLRFAMRNICFAAAALCLLAVPCARAQARPTPASHPFLIRLPEYADTEDLEIHYRLIGPFGGYRSFVRTGGGTRVYKVEASYEGKAARSLSAVI